MNKIILIEGIKQCGGVVGMSGEGVSDAAALKLADVGLCMGQGTQVTKDCSDLVILDNNFFSIYNAIMWGRTIFENVKKFC